MKTISTLLALLSAGGSLCATVVGVDSVEQPVNLGANADPSRIPLGPVAVESNHGYGKHPIISAPRPCTHGVLKLKDGIELNMNLASAFGILVVPEDSSNVPHSPVALEIKDWPVPAYSPYRKEQVLAAVIHCLLRSTGASPKRPLKIQIKAEDPDDQRMLKGYAGNYISVAKDGPSPVPGTHLTSDARGVTWVVFSEASAPEPKALRRPPPAIVPMCFQEGEHVALVPVWAGDDWADAAPVLTQPVTLFYDVYQPGHTFGPDINYATHSKLIFLYNLKEQGGHYSLSLYVGKPKTNYTHLTNTLCATLYAAVLTTQPTEQKPLMVTISIIHEMIAELPAFANDPLWTVSDPKPLKGGRDLSAKFVWDPVHGRLSSGSIPAGTLKRSERSRWYLDFYETPVAAARKPALPAEGKREK